MANIYSKYSTYEVGMQVQGENAAGERLNITLRSSVPYSNDGIKMHDCELIKDGVLKNVHGGLRMSQYLKVQPTGEYNKLLVDNGSESIADMKKTCASCSKLFRFQYECDDRTFRRGDKACLSL